MVSFMEFGRRDYSLFFDILLLMLMPVVLLIMIFFSPLLFIWAAAESILEIPLFFKSSFSSLGELFFPVIKRCTDGSQPQPMAGGGGRKYKK